MKRYALLVGGLLLLVAVMGLPPRYYEITWFTRMDRRTPERSRFLELDAELQRTAWLHQKIQWRDSIAGVLQPLDPRETPYVLAAPPGTPEELRSRVDSGVVRQLDALGPPAPEMPIGVFLMPRAEKLHPEAPKNRLGIAWNHREFYVGREGEAPFCALVEPVGEMGFNDPAQIVVRLVSTPRSPGEKPNTLRVCGYFARYGSPGPEILGWLRDGASLFGQGANLDRGLAFFLTDGGHVRGPFGLWAHYSGLSPTGMACLAGVEAACRDFFLEPGGDRDDRRTASWAIHDQVEHSPVDFARTRFLLSGQDFGPLDPHVLEALEADFGPDRFGSFWRSTLPVAEAFRSAFGLSAEDWVMGWAQGYFGSIARGPGVPPGETFLTLLTLGFLFSGALYLGRHRG